MFGGLLTVVLKSLERGRLTIMLDWNVHNAIITYSYIIYKHKHKYKNTKPNPYLPGTKYFPTSFSFIILSKASWMAKYMSGCLGEMAIKY
jgi:hypothetical protein